MSYVSEYLKNWRYTSDDDKEEIEDARKAGPIPAYRTTGTDYTGKEFQRVDEFRPLQLKAVTGEPFCYAIRREHRLRELIDIWNRSSSNCKYELC